MPALTLTTAGAMLLAGLERTRRRTALALVLPVLMLCALGWLLVHADEPLATRRAFAMAEHPSTLTDFQRANLHAFLGQRAMDLGQPEVGARELERAFDLGGNGRRALMASEAWLEAGNPDAARRALAKARAPRESRTRARGRRAPDRADARRGRRRLRARLDAIRRGAAAPLTTHTPIECVNPTARRADIPRAPRRLVMEADHETSVSSPCSFSPCSS